MSKKKLWSIVAIAAVLVGLALIAGVFFAIRFDFSKLATETYVRGEYALEEPFDEIEINTTFFDVRIFPVDAEQASVAYLPYSGNVTHNVTVRDGKLSVFIVDSRAWYEKLFFDGITNENTVIELRVPHAQYEKLAVRSRSGDVLVDGKNDDGDALLFGTVRVEANSGDIEFRAGTLSEGSVALFADTGDIVVSGTQGSGLTAHTDTGHITVLGCAPATALSLKTSTGEITLADVSVTGGLLAIETDSGDVEMRNVRAQDLKLEADTGDVEMMAVLVTGELRVETDTGEVDIKRSDAGSIYLESDTGDVEMELLTGKMFTVETDTGDRRHPASDRNGGICRVKTDTGDVEITVLAPAAAQ